MTPRILFIGGGGGSWTMRGGQMAAALPARATTDPTPADYAWADVIVLVKRAIERWGAAARDTGKPIVWDVLDFWAQPQENETPIGTLAARVAELKRRYRVHTVIGATEAMAEAIGGVYLPHHCRLGLAPAPIVDRATVVAYDGSTRYLGAWKAALERTCPSLGLTFTTTPSDLRTVDILVAFRDGPWNGPACRAWKSGVKYVNAIAAGRPILTMPCAAYDEVRPPGLAIARIDQLASGLAHLATLEQRRLAYEHGLRRAAQFTVSAVAAQYRSILATTVARAA